MDAVESSQASTQGYHATQDVIDLPPDIPEGNRVWGKLLSEREGVPAYNLFKEIHSFGRGKVDHQFDSTQFGSVFFTAISKTHFKISQVRKSAAEITCVLEDLSCNGTYVNRKLVGKNQKIILQNNDEIALATPEKKVFVFHDCLKNDDADYPLELTQHYTVTRKLGEGTFGEVRLAYRHGTLERVAVKILRKKGTQLLFNNVRQIDNEIKLLQSVNHPNIIRFQGVIDTPDKIYIIMEVAEGGELFDLLVTNRRLPEMTVKFYFYQLVLAVQYLHKKNITHRDIKPENVLLATDEELTHVKLTDFGLSKFAADTSQMTTFCGTPTYIAPELLELGNLSYTNKVDMWSLGVVLYVSLVGYPPFNLDDDIKLRYQIKNAVYNFNHKFWSNISNEAKDLISKLMVKDPQYRLSAEETLNHPWLQDENMINKIMGMDDRLATAKKRRRENDDDDTIDNNMNGSEAKTPRINIGNICDNI